VLQDAESQTAEEEVVDLIQEEITEEAETKEETEEEEEEDFEEEALGAVAGLKGGSKHRVKKKRKRKNPLVAVEMHGDNRPGAALRPLRGRKSQLGSVGKGSAATFLTSTEAARTKPQTTHSRR
jgi:hypothetical protein